METPDFTHLDYVQFPVFVLVVRDDGVPVYITLNAFGRAIAKRPLSDFVGRSALDIYPGAFGRTAYARHCEVADKGAAMTYELDLPLGGVTRAIRTTLVPCRDDTGAVRYLYGTSQDVTADRATHEARISYETVMAEMEQFIALAAHDLRAPMRNIALLADMLREDFVDYGDGKLELITMMEDVATKSMALISDVLSHARAGAPNESAAATFNFAALCRDICDVLDPQGHHSITSTQADLTTDRTALQIVLRNLLDNAIKYGGRAALEIDITVRAAAEGTLAVTLTDNGVGFSDPAIVFLDGGALKIDSGYGLLGVRRLIAARQGEICATNSETGGAVIRFTLPGTWAGATASLGDTALSLPQIEEITPTDGHQSP